MDSTRGELPKLVGGGVSVIIPVLNEERHLAETVSSVLEQHVHGELELILALGPSHDRSSELAAKLAASDPRIKLVQSPTGRTPNGLNLALAVAQFPVVARVDGHAIIPPGYLDAAVVTLDSTGADNVGGIMAAQGVSVFERSVAAAMTSRLGVGSAAFHVGGAEGEAETVYLGCFRRDALDRVGGYDEEFTRAQDWDLNHRIRSTGGLVWFTPKLQVTYRPRSGFASLSRQYFQYGSWRREVMRRHPETVWRASALRYLAPPTVLLVLLVSVTIGVVGVFAGPSWLVLGLGVPLAYLLLLVLAALAQAPRLGVAAACLPAVVAVMHLSWGSGFLIRGLSRASTAKRHP